MLDPEDDDPLTLEADAPDKGGEARVAIEADDVRWLMSGPRGRRILWSLLEASGLGGSCYTPGKTSALDLAYAAGRREIGDFLVDRIRTHAADLYPALIEEQRSLRRATGQRDTQGDHGRLAEHAAR